jgi:LmbE family N-acetylglucosaminyl deacetylase
MMGWPQNDAEGSFWTTPVDEAAGRLSELIDKYRPQVVVTYDENGFYGHPDHIQANRVTVAALEATGAVDKLYYPVVGASSLARFRELIVEAGVQSVPEASEDWDFAVADELVTTSVDCADYLSQQFSALAAHASQDDGTFFLRLGVDLFSRLMNPMTFTRVFDRTGSPIPEDDLFVGLR